MKMKKMNKKIKRNHLLYITIMMVVLSIFYYLSSIIALVGGEAPNWFILNMPHDLHRSLFFIPVLYAAYKFRIKGTIVTTVISLLIFLPRALFISPYPYALIRPIVFTIGLWFSGFFLAMALNAIAERKQAEKNLISAKTYTESIIQNFLDTLIVVDMEAKIKTVNPETCRLLGYTKEELIGQPVSMIFAEEEEEEEVKSFFSFFRDPRNKEALNMQGAIRNRQLTYKTKDGQLIPMSFNASVMKDEAGNITGVVAGAKDLTEIKQAEEERLKTEKNFREVIENIFKFVPEGLLVFTDKLNLLKENKAFQDIVKEYSAKLNYTEQELREIIIEQLKNRIVKENHGEIRIAKKQDR